jgi:hypothetical protein
MKTITLFLLANFIALLFACESGKTDTPETVKKTFANMFPDASDVEWKMEDDMWEAEFESEGASYEVSFYENGDWYETEFEIKLADLPETAMFILEADYAGLEILETEVVERADFSGYEVEVEKDGKELELYFNEAGELVAIDADEEEEED